MGLKLFDRMLLKHLIENISKTFFKGDLGKSKIIK